MEPLGSLSSYFQYHFMTILCKMCEIKEVCAKFIGNFKLTKYPCI